MVDPDADTLASYFDWSSHVIFYPSGRGGCVICDDPHLPTVAAYPDAGNPPRPSDVCVDCLSDFEDFEMFGESILELCDLGFREVDPDHRVDVAFECPHDWPGLWSPTYAPWDELHVAFDAEEVDVPASRSPFETKTVRAMRIDDSSCRLVVDGVELEYDSYVPVDVESIE